MGSYTKVYQRKYDPARTLVLTWDIGYKNVVLIDGKRIVGEWGQPGVFQKGIKLNDDKLGVVKIRFTDERPIQLELRVNGKKYIPRKKEKGEVSVLGPIILFWIMFAGSCFLLNSFMTSYNHLRGSQVYNLIFAITSGICAIHGFTALMLTFKKYWAFFVGYGYVILSFFLYLISFSVSPDVMTLFIIVFRVISILFLSLSIRSVLYAIRSKKNNDEVNSSVIDSEL